MILMIILQLAVFWETPQKCLSCHGKILLSLFIRKMSFVIKGNHKECCFISGLLKRPLFEMLTLTLVYVLGFFVREVSKRPMI